MEGVPVYIPFSWNTPIIRHTFQRGYSMQAILDEFKVATTKMFEQLGVETPTFQLTQKLDNMFLIQIDAVPVGASKRLFKRLIQVNVVFSDHNGVYTTEILRRMGDYLSFMRFYASMFQHFNCK